jgi:hypothetical protein
MRVTQDRHCAASGQGHRNVRCTALSRRALRAASNGGSGGSDEETQIQRGPEGVSTVDGLGKCSCMALLAK